MIWKNALIFGIISTGIISCSETTDPEVQDEVEVTGESDQRTESDIEDPLVETEASEVISFDESSRFTITQKNVGINSATGTDNYDIFLNNELFSAPIKLTRELAMLKLEPGVGGVPENAVFGYSTWFAGGGEVYYGIVKDGILQIYRNHEHEEMVEAGEFSLYREIDPNVQLDKPSYYIHYSPDSEEGNDIMIACSSDGKGLYAKYEGQSRQIGMKFSKDESEGRNIIQCFDEIVNGEVNGTYKMAHSGNYDYVEYTNKKSGKKYTFTINFDETIEGDTYRTTPSL